MFVQFKNELHFHKLIAKARGLWGIEQRLSIKTTSLISQTGRVQSVGHLQSEMELNQAAAMTNLVHRWRSIYSRSSEF